LGQKLKHNKKAVFRTSMESKDAPQLIEHASKSVNFTPFEVKWVPVSARFVALGVLPKGSGAMKIYGLEGGKVECLAESDKKEGIKCGTFGASLFEDRHLATGNYAGELNVWDLERLSTPIFNVKGSPLVLTAPSFTSASPQPTRRW
jgi:hypothetical protein